MFSAGRVNDVVRLRFRVGSILVLRECLRLWFAWIMVWAVVVVGFAAVFRVDPFVLLWGLVGLAVAAAAGTALGMRKSLLPPPFAPRWTGTDASAAC